jgi:hypothetical protein
MSNDRQAVDPFTPGVDGGGEGGGNLAGLHPLGKRRHLVDDHANRKILASRCVKRQGENMRFMSRGNQGGSGVAHVRADSAKPNLGPLMGEQGNPHVLFIGRCRPWPIEFPLS